MPTKRPDPQDTRGTMAPSRGAADSRCRWARPSGASSPGAAARRVTAFGVACLLLLALGRRAEALDLEEALAAARRSAPSVVARRYDVEHAEALGRQALSARFPRVSARVSGTYNAYPPDPVTIESGAFGSLPNPLDPSSSTPIPEEDVAVTDEAKHTFYSLRVTVDQPLYASGRIRAETEAAVLQQAAARADLDAEVRLAERHIREVFATVVYAESARELVGEMESFARANLVDRRQAFTEGTVNRETVLQAELDVVRLESQAVDFAEIARTARASLALLIGRSVDDALDYELASAAPELDESVLGAAAIQAAAERTAARARAEQARASVGAVTRPLRPSVGLQVAGEVSGQATPFSEEDWEQTWDPTLRVSLSVDLPVFDGGWGRAETEARQIRADQAYTGIAAVEDRLVVDLRRSVETVRRAAAAAARTRAAAALASERRRNAEISFENGLLRASAARSAATGELARRLEHLSARFDLEMGLIAVRYLVGRELD